MVILSVGCERIGNMMSAELVNLAGESGTIAERLLELAEDWHDYGPGRESEQFYALWVAATGPGVGRSEVEALCDAVEAWHELDDRYEGARNVYGVTYEALTTDVLRALWRLYHTRPACPACADLEQTAARMRVVDEGETLCPEHKASTCNRCRVMHLTIRATEQIDGAGYCSDCAHVVRTRAQQRREVAAQLAVTS